LLVGFAEPTVARYIEDIGKAANILVNVSTGIYEQPASAMGTERPRTAVPYVPGYPVIGGGVVGAGRFGVRKTMGQACSLRRRMVCFPPGQTWPIVEASRRAADRFREGRGS
jgi:hypothetical protein